MKQTTKPPIIEWKQRLQTEPERVLPEVLEGISNKKFDKTVSFQGQINVFFFLWYSCDTPEREQLHKLLLEFLQGKATKMIQVGEPSELNTLQKEIDSLENELNTISEDAATLNRPSEDPELSSLRQEEDQLNQQIQALNQVQFPDNRKALEKKIAQSLEQVNQHVSSAYKDISQIESMASFDYNSLAPEINRLNRACDQAKERLLSIDQIELNDENMFIFQPKKEV